jgi:hypothetical protein
MILRLTTVREHARSALECRSEAEWSCRLPLGKNKAVAAATSLQGASRIFMAVPHGPHNYKDSSPAIVDMNRDGKLDIVSGENWFEQAAPAAPGEGPRWIKHKFRSLPYTDFHLKDLSDLAIDVK